ncbi:MAG: DUF1926 domain-containing protein [Endomicrobiales bacterium]|nr:DUF1926 domain-containing protein [Endomicrobiales bacterium]
MKEIYFLFGVHNHQPVGNFPEVFEDAYQKAYLPFVRVLSNHPSVKWSLHCSGILWDFISEKHPEYMEIIKKMVKSGQVELLTGGYYEPILPSISDKDKKGQIGKLNRFLRDKFNFNAKGIWLTERVWEPYLAKILAEMGVRFTIVDDTHFAAAGMDVDKLKGYYITEEQGSKLNIFPINKLLRYYIPFKTVEKNIEYFASCAQEYGAPAITMADDGEKFGLWPETYKHIYEDKWLENFLTALESNSSWIKTLTFSEYLDKFPPEGNVYLPTASYFELSEWALPQKTQSEFESLVKQFDLQPNIKKFLKGGFWRNFLTKYPESNNMHKKMFYVSEKVNSMVNNPVNSKNKKERNRKTDDNAQKAFNALYAGQCNCAYWHGVFGGLYLPHLRNAIYQKLIEAESLATKKDANGYKWKSYDINYDGKAERLYESSGQNLYFSPQKGGSLFEWDLIEKKVNFMNVLTRRQESYHQRLREFLANKESQSAQGNQVKTIHDLVKVKEENLDKYLNYDWYSRASLIDHFLHPNTKFEDFRNSKYGEQGDFVLGDYEAEVDSDKLVLKRRGTFWEGDNPRKIEVKKTIVPNNTSLRPGNCGFKVFYQLKNLENADIKMVFAPEFSFAFSYASEDENRVINSTKAWDRKDEGYGFLLKTEFSEDIELWTFPLETVSLSENGFERTYQGTVMLPVFRKDIPGNKEINLEIDIQIKK